MSAPVTQLNPATGQAQTIDLYAAGLSMLCIVHCLALPLLTSFLPLLGYLSENEAVHQLLVLMAAPATLWVVWQSTSTFRRRWPFIVAALSGLFMLLLAGFVAALEHYEQWLTIIGALCLATAHLWRWSRHTASITPNRRRTDRKDVAPSPLRNAQ